MSLYVYCVTDEPHPNATFPKGIQDQLPRILDEGAFRVTVSDFQDAALRPEKENLFAHERVIDVVMDHTTPLPFRFGTVVAERAIREFLQKNEGTLRADLDKVRGCVEMGIKVMTNATAEFSAGREFNSGTEFLKAKLEKQAFLKDTASWVEAGIVGLVRQTDIRFMPISTKNIVRIAHLVTRDHLDEYKTHMDTLVRNRTDCAFLRSGPWPPYSFISAPRLG